MAIAFGVAGNNGGKNSTSITVTVTTTAGNCVVACISTATTTATVSSVTDTGGSAYSFQAAINNGTSVRTEIWSTTATGSLASTTVTVNFSASQAAGAVCIAEYTGVVALGTTNTGTQGTANPTISLTTQDNNNWVVACHGSNAKGGFTAGTGNLRTSKATSGAAPNDESDAVDNTAASPSSVTCSATSVDTVWAMAALELRSTSGGGGPTNNNFLMMLGCGT